VIGLTRLYCYKGELFRLVDVCSRDASNAADALTKEGWTIEAEIPV
jgi:hypothetical protein